MKKITTFLFALFFATSLSYSQAVDIGSKVINLDVGFLNSFGYGSVKVPPVSVSFDYLLTKIGPGTLGLGVAVGYATSEDKLKLYPNYYHTYTYIPVGARGTYHWFPVQNDKIDAYAGVIIGYNIISSKYTGLVGSTVTPYGSKMLGGVFAGMRYFFNDHFGVNAELGYGVALLNVGGSVKF
jgi:hypothetical protein